MICEDKAFTEDTFFNSIRVWAFLGFSRWRGDAPNTTYNKAKTLSLFYKLLKIKVASEPHKVAIVEKVIEICRKMRASMKRANKIHRMRYEQEGELSKVGKWLSVRIRTCSSCILTYKYIYPWVYQINELQTLNKNTLDRMDFIIKNFGKANTSDKVNLAKEYQACLAYVSLIFIGAQRRQALINMTTDVRLQPTSPLKYLISNSTTL